MCLSVPQMMSLSIALFFLNLNKQGSDFTPYVKEFLHFTNEKLLQSDISQSEMKVSCEDISCSKQKEIASKYEALIETDVHKKFKSHIIETRAGPPLLNPIITWYTTGIAEECIELVQEAKASLHNGSLKDLFLRNFKKC